MEGGEKGKGSKAPNGNLMTIADRSHRAIRYPTHARTHARNLTQPPAQLIGRDLLCIHMWVFFLAVSMSVYI